MYIYIYICIYICVCIYIYVLLYKISENLLESKPFKTSRELQYF